jgi:hypothetical protein
VEGLPSHECYCGGPTINKTVSLNSIIGNNFQVHIMATKKANVILGVPDMRQDFKSDTCSIEDTQQCFKGVYREFTFKPNSHCRTMGQLMMDCEPGIIKVLQFCVKKRINVKAYCSVPTLMQKVNISDGTVEREELGYFSTHARPVNVESDIQDLLSYTESNINEKIENFVNKGSSWVVGEVQKLILKLVVYRPTLF